MWPRFWGFRHDVFWSSSNISTYPRERVPSTHWIEGWVGSRAGMDDVERRKILTLSGLEVQYLGQPAHSQSLYQLHYPGSPIQICVTKLNDFLGLPSLVPEVCDRVPGMHWSHSRPPVLYMHFKHSPVVLLQFPTALGSTFWLQSQGWHTRTGPNLPVGSP
jgi:hypothetical protein